MNGTRLISITVMSYQVVTRPVTHGDDPLLLHAYTSATYVRIPPPLASIPSSIMDTAPIGLKLGAVLEVAPTIKTISIPEASPS